MLVENIFKLSRVILKIIFILLSVIFCDSKPLKNQYREEDPACDSDFTFPTKPNQHPNIPSENNFRNYIHQKKITILIIILSFCFICAIILSFVYVHNDFKELNNFYRGYMGRRLLIKEKRLVYKKKEQKMKTDLKNINQQSSQGEYMKLNGEKITEIKESLGPVPTQILLSPIADYICQDYLMPGLPVVRKCVEDEEPEWRHLDYQSEVGKPPASFCSFIKQYGWNIYTADGLTQQEIKERKNLFNQYRKWKKLKVKTFNIVVTERARREMADQEEKKNKK